MLVCASTVFAQPTQQDFEWAWKDAASMTLPKGTHASWMELVYPQMTGEEAAALLDQIGDNQAEPRWATARHAQWLNGEPQKSEYNLWYIDDSHFRLNNDLPQAEWSPDVDAVVNGNEGWTRGANGALTALDLRNPPKTRDPRTFLSEVHGYVTNFLAGGMGRYDISNVAKFTINDDNRWSATLLSQDGGVKYRLDGEYKSDTEQFLILQSKIIASKDRPNSVGNTVVYKDHKPNSFIHWYMPEQVEVKNARGAVLREYRALEIKYFDPDKFDSYATLPVGDHVDPLRPDVELRRIDDFRTATATRTEIDRSSGEQSLSLLADDREFADGSYWNKIGWVAVVVIAAAFVVIQVRKGA